MRTWFHQHRNALWLALRRLGGSPVNTVLSMLAIGIALALPVGGLVIYANVQQLVRNTNTLPQISVFLKLDAERKTAIDLESRFRQYPAVESVRFLPREATLKRMRDAEGLSDVINALPRNPFPDAFVITPANTGAADMERLATEFRGWPQVEFVQVDSAWVRRLGAMLSLARTALGVLALLLGIGLVAITVNTIRLQVLTLRNEIEVSRLLGATDAFISRPFFYLGTLQGALGGIVAWLVVAAASIALRGPLTELAALYGLDLVIALPGAGVTLCLIGTAAGLGWIGTALSLSQYLRSSTMR